MIKKLLTLDDLYQFFVEQNKTVDFSSKESGSPIVVSLPGTFAKTDDSMPGLLKLKLKVCHTQLNRNGSFISQENMEKGMPTLKYRPILAYIHELEDGTKDFYAHNVEIIENENGDADVNYIEKQVGCFTADDPWLEYDKEMDKTYVMAYSVIPEEYTEAADIIRRKNGTKVSCELVINELSYNAKEKYLDLTDFYFSGCTLLGCDEDGNEIGEGMLGSRADIADFCHKEPKLTYQDKLIETLEKLNVTLEGFNKHSKEGGDVAMDNLENEIVEEVVAEMEETPVEDAPIEETTTEDEVVVVEEETEVDETEVEKPSIPEDGDETPSEEKFVRTFTVELSHEDIHCALYRLIDQYEEEDNEYYYIRNVYDDHFVMQGWAYGKLYKVGYEVNGENVSLKGERQEVFELIVTESEKIAIEKMREDYSALEEKYAELKAFKENYDAATIKAEKDAIFESVDYDEIRESDEFKTLMSEMDQYSVDELKTRADLLYAASMKKKFAVEPNKPAQRKSVGFNYSAKPNKKKQAYAGLFDKD